jgi:hypothetical protein
MSIEEKNADPVKHHLYVACRSVTQRAIPITEINRFPYHDTTRQLTRALVPYVLRY